MPKEVLCPICGAAYNLADEQLGKKVRCKKCEHAFTAGDKPRRRDEDDDAPRGRSRAKKKSRDRDEEDDKPKKTKSIEEQAKPKGQRDPGLPVSSFVIMGIVVAVLVVCCGGGGLVLLLMHGSDRPNNQRPNLPPNKNRRGEVPALRPPVAWLQAAEGVRQRAGEAARIAVEISPTRQQGITLSLAGASG